MWIMTRLNNISHNKMKKIFSIILISTISICGTFAQIELDDYEKSKSYIDTMLNIGKQDYDIFSIYDSTFQRSYKVVSIDFMPQYSFSKKQFYLIQIIDSTETCPYTVFSFCDDSLTRCTDPLQIGQFYQLTLHPLEPKPDDGMILMYRDRVVKFKYQDSQVYVSYPTTLYLAVSALEIREIFYVPTSKYFLSSPPQ